MSVFIWPCECGRFKFVFPAAPSGPVSCVCPECREERAINPETKETVKTSAKAAKKEVSTE